MQYAFAVVLEKSLRTNGRLNVTQSVSTYRANIRVTRPAREAAQLNVGTPRPTWKPPPRGNYIITSISRAISIIITSDSNIHLENEVSIDSQL